jgi:hypothetical protein
MTDCLEPADPVTGARRALAHATVELVEAEQVQKAAGDLLSQVARDELEISIQGVSRELQRASDRLSEVVTALENAIVAARQELRG